MKANFKMIGAGLMMSGLLVVSGCGSDNNYTAAPKVTGKVVKGPVNDATVTAADGKTTAKTGVDGSFTIGAVGPYSTTGGVYVPLKADGTPGTPVAAPNMSCPVGVTQITPISTLVQQATVAAATGDATAVAALAKLKALVEANGGLNVDLSTKTAANAGLLTLSETVGAVLAAAANSSTTPATALAALTAATNALITSVAAIPTTTTLAAALTAGTLTATINAAITTASAALTSAGFAAVAQTAVAAANTATTVFSSTTLVPIGYTPPTTTVTTKTGTGGSGGSGF